MNDLQTLRQGLTALTGQPNVPASFFDLAEFKLVRKVSVPLVRAVMKYDFSWDAEVATHRNVQKTRRYDNGAFVSFNEEWTEWNSRSDSDYGLLRLLPLYAGIKEPPFVILAAEGCGELNSVKHAGFTEEEKFQNPNSYAALRTRISNNTEAEISRLVRRDLGRKTGSEYTHANYSETYEIDQIIEMRVPVTVFEREFKGKTYRIAVSGVSQHYVGFDDAPSTSFFIRNWLWLCHFAFWIPSFFDWKLWISSFCIAVFWSKIRENVAKWRRVSRIRKSFDRQIDLGAEPVALARKPGPSDRADKKNHERNRQKMQNLRASNNEKLPKEPGSRQNSEIVSRGGSKEKGQQGKFSGGGLSAPNAPSGSKIFSQSTNTALNSRLKERYAKYNPQKKD